jgi:cation transport protein ChaC
LTEEPLAFPTIALGIAFGQDLRRDDFNPERVEMYRAYIAARGGGGMTFLTNEEREANRRNFLNAHPPGQDLWLFGYGSLMWNPAIHVEESAAARIEGFHRSFCLTMSFGRGTPEKPGLMLVLRPGGACGGVAHRIEARKVQSETEILWMREMLSGAYLPQWLDIRLPKQSVRGFTFVAHDGHSRIEEGLTEEAVALRIAHAAGERGTNRDYLFAAAKTLKNYDLSDDYVTRIEARVGTLISTNNATTGERA